MNLLLIHGRAQEGNDPVRLQAEWEEALGKGLQKAGLQRPADIRVVFPFYGDELDRIVRELEAPLMKDIVTRGAAADNRELEFRAEMFAEMAAGYAISDEEIQRQFGGEPQERGPLNWKWVQATLRVLDRTPLGDSAIDRFTRDVYVYLTYPAATRVIDRIVTEKLAPGQWVVVGHSLGSVVGYNVLRDVRDDAGIDVTRYVTVGSPLGVRAVRRRLASPLTMPACVKDWYNAFDRRDVVALYGLDAQNFPIHPPITNKGTVDNFTENRHGIVGYLEDADVSRKIVEALRT